MPSSLTSLNSSLQSYTMVDLSSAVRRGHPIAYGLFAFFALIVAIIASAVVADFNSNGEPAKKLARDSTRFLVFAGWWGFLFSLVYVRLIILTCRLACSCLVSVDSCLPSPRTPCLSLSLGCSGWPVPPLYPLPSATQTAARAPAVSVTAQRFVRSVHSPGSVGWN